MKFRTEIELPRSSHRITHDDGGIVLLGSCFSDNIGASLETDGFEACHNPMGPMYNPASLHKFIERLLDGYIWSETDLTMDSTGTFHALDFPLRYSSVNSAELLTTINRQATETIEKFRKASTIIVTFGTSWCFELVDKGCVVGNCHKFPASFFKRRRMPSDEICQLWQPLVERLNSMAKHVIATVSPIRHIADGLHGNQLSKATLMLAIDDIEGMEYFPAYEILVDDLRDYRFYADDMKHPAQSAVKYIYEIFSSTYFSKATLAEAARRHAEQLRQGHRQLL